MNSVSNIPVSGLTPEVPLPSATAVVLPEHKRAPGKLKDRLLSIYAYGLLSFGLLAPFALAAWTALFGSAPQ